jgi:peroxisomal 3,2-trans-enoyl-CoA isomerase
MRILTQSLSSSGRIVYSHHFSKCARSFSQQTPYILVSRKDGVTTLQMNRPKQLNGWTFPMMQDLKLKMEECEKDPDTKVCVLTGSGPYYCAGVNLSAMIQPQHPAKLHALIREQNQALFEVFLNFPKPIIAAVNGPAIGASVTSATLCDALVASDSATFSVPFARLGVPPEGCSSVNFERFMGQENAERMLGAEGWVPNAQEAVAIGLATECVTCTSDHSQPLVDRANEIGQEWIREGKTRSLPHGGTMELMEKMKEVNVTESALLADGKINRELYFYCFEQLF